MPNHTEKETDGSIVPISDQIISETLKNTILTQQLSQDTLNTVKEWLRHGNHTSADEIISILSKE